MSGERKKWNVVSGFLHEDEAVQLQKLTRNKTVLEIGCLYGKSTVCIAEVATQIHTVDTFTVSGNGADQVDEINENIRKSFFDNIQGYSNISLHEGRSDIRVPELENEYFDVVYIDGSHIYEDVLCDIDLCWPKLKYGGIMLLHDYGERGWSGVNKAVDEFWRLTGVERIATSFALIRKEM